MEKGSSHSLLARQAMSLTRKGRKHSEETRLKMSLAQKGVRKSPEHIAAAALARTGVCGYKLSDETKRKMSIAKKRDGVTPPVASTSGTRLWKTNKAAYSNLHAWVRRHFGSPTECEDCGIEATGRFMQWANRSGEYTKDRSDWRRLCAKCHKRYDMRNITWTPA